MAMETGFLRGNRAQVKARAEWANRTGSWEDDPPTTGEQLDGTQQDGPEALEGSSNQAEEGRNEETLCAFAIIYIRFIHNTCR